MGGIRHRAEYLLYPALFSTLLYKLLKSSKIPVSAIFLWLLRWKYVAVWVFLCLYRWDGLHPYFFQQIGHRGNSGFTGGVWYISALAFKIARTERKIQLSEAGVVYYPYRKRTPYTPSKTGVESVMIICFLTFTTCCPANNLIPPYNINRGSSSGSLRSR